MCLNAGVVSHLEREFSLNSVGDSDNAGPVSVKQMERSRTHSHTHQRINPSPPQHAHGSPHDADVANSGMEPWVDAEAPVTQSLPNLITGGFTQTDEERGHQGADRWTSHGC